MYRTCARDLDVFFLAMDGGTVLGCIRYCVEEGTPMLRTMMTKIMKKSCRTLCLPGASCCSGGSISEKPPAES
jgi:hypothetical protein